MFTTGGIKDFRENKFYLNNSGEIKFSEKKVRNEGLDSNHVFRKKIYYFGDFFLKKKIIGIFFSEKKKFGEKISGIFFLPKKK